MFDLTSSKLLILAVVALLVVGPKELPGLLRTVGKYVGMIRRQANEFRAQFDEAMRESELAEIKKDFEKLGQETKATLDDAGRSLDTQIGDIDQTVRDAARIDTAPPQSYTPAALSDAAAGPAMTEHTELAPPVAPIAAKPREQLVGAGAVSGSPHGGA